MKKILMSMIISLLFLLESLNAVQSEFNDEFNSEFTEVEKVYDPLSGYNEIMTTFNDAFYMNVLMPVTQTYAEVVDKNIRIGVSNVFENLLFPIRFVNNFLQFKMANASEELGRFALNSTFGLLGIMDLGKDFNLKAHKEDFGQTLGFYGVGSGFHIVIPFLGPSNARDILGFTADSLVNPLSTDVAYEPYQIPNNMLQEVGYKTLNTVNEQSFNPNNYENLKKEAVVLYPFLRDIYEQRRKKLIEE
jgi:phospholipid-binding lipoprotein MlaA